MNYKTHNDVDIDTKGTSFKAYINATYGQLVALFGEPLAGDEVNTDFEWHIQLELGPVLTIYDWKTKGWSHDVTRWHVGARNLDDVCLLDAIIDKGPQ